MKKVIIGFLSIIFIGQIAVAQPVSDHAVIPMAITVQSVLRLNVRSGGNIEFVFSNITTILSGIANTTAYNTTFDVASTLNWDVLMGTDAATLTSDEGAAIPLDHINFYMSGGGINVARTSTPFPVANPALLTNVTTPILEWVGGLNTNVGNAAANTFIINWAAGIAPSPAMTGTAPGRYTVNVYLSLVPAT